MFVFFVKYIQFEDSSQNSGHEEIHKIYDSYEGRR